MPKIRPVFAITSYQSITGSFYVKNGDKNPIADAWNGQGAFNHETMIWNRLNEISVKSARDMEDFRTDFKRVLHVVAKQTEHLINERMPYFDQRSQQAFNELSLILERGMDNTQAGVNDLLKYVSQPLNFPSASVYTTAYFRGASTGALRKALRIRLEYFNDLLREVRTAKDLRPGNDLFGVRLSQLRALRDGSSEAQTDRNESKPWYRRMF
jgi:hypothetical protein